MSGGKQSLPYHPGFTVSLDTGCYIVCIGTVQDYIPNTVLALLFLHTQHSNVLDYCIVQYSLQHNSALQSTI